MLLPRVRDHAAAFDPPGGHHGRRRLFVLAGMAAVAVATGSASMAALGNGAVTSSSDATRRPSAPMQTTVRPGASMSRGVVTPRGDVDPGMATKAPHMPAQSTPVIHPQATGDAGSVIVPR